MRSQRSSRVPCPCSSAKRLTESLQSRRPGSRFPLLKLRSAYNVSLDFRPQVSNRQMSDTVAKGPRRKKDESSHGVPEICCFCLARVSTGASGQGAELGRLIHSVPLAWGWCGTQAYCPGQPSCPHKVRPV